jgi:hypothetical protein
MTERYFRCRKSFPLVALFVLLSATAGLAQTTTFTYQGRLVDGGTPANGSYDLQFALWDSAAGGTQIGSTQTVSSVAVASGIFTVTLDFGANAFPGANRFLEISARQSGAGSFTLLSPRQPVTSTPYALRSLGATAADTLSSACVGCVTVAKGGTGATSFTANTPLIGNGSNAVSVGSRSGNTTTFATTNGALTGSHCVQIDSSGNLVDSGVACGGGGGGALPDPGSNGIIIRTATNTTAARSLAAGSPLAITNADGTAGNPTIDLTGVVSAANGGTGLGASGASGNFLKSNGSLWTSAALSATDIPSGNGSYIQNTMSPQSSSNFNISGNGTAGGTLSGSVVNATTQYNLGGLFFASAPGTDTFVGDGAGGSNNTGNNNTFVGFNAGPFNTMGSNNDFFGDDAGFHNTLGQDNAFFGDGAGATNTTGSFNTIVGSAADVGSGNLTNATAIGRQAFVTQSNSLVLGSINGTNFAGADTKVGIGTTAPSTLLHVVRGSSSGVADLNAIATLERNGNGYLQLLTPNTNESAVLFGNVSSSAAGGVVYNNSGTPDGLQFRTNGNVNRMVVDSSGNVGIGTTAPNTFKLQVAGAVGPNGDNMHALGDASHRWTAVFAVNGTIQTSDARLKQRVSNLRYGLREVMQLRPVSFEWKDKPDGPLNLGLLAQEVEGVVPEVVVRDANPATPLGMNYTSLLPVVIKAIQEQQATITALKAENAALNARLRGVEKSLRKKAGSARRRR